jgi:gas vesicle protein
MNLKEKLQELGESSQQNYEQNLEKLLHRMGLEKKRSTPELLLPALGIFGAGMAVGATLGVLFAPKKGDKLRGDLRKRLEDLKARSSEQYQDLKDRSEEAIKRLNEQETSQQAPSRPNKKRSAAKKSSSKKQAETSTTQS